MSYTNDETFWLWVKILSNVLVFFICLNDLKITANKDGYDYTVYKSTQSKLTNLKGNPFNQTLARFVTFDYKIRSTLSFSQYRISVFSNENFRKVVVEGSKNSLIHCD